MSRLDFRGAGRSQQPAEIIRQVTGRSGTSPFIGGPGDSETETLSDVKSARHSVCHTPAEMKASISDYLR